MSFFWLRRSATTKAINKGNNKEDLTWALTQLAARSKTVPWLHSSSSVLVLTVCAAAKQGCWKRVLDSGWRNHDVFRSVSEYPDI